MKAKLPSFYQNIKQFNFITANIYQQIIQITGL